MKGYDFGIKHPENTKVTQWWGARAIYKHNAKGRRIDVLIDRQSHGETVHTQEFKDFINSFIMKLEKGCKMSFDSAEVVNHKDGKYIGQASPKGSCGYLYIGCWEID